MTPCHHDTTKIPLVKGVAIQEVSQGLYTFQLYHAKDINRVLSGGPWTFNNQMLIVKQLHTDDNPSMVDLFHASF